jgi:hypothetical protein
VVAVDMLMQMCSFVLLIVIASIYEVAAFPLEGRCHCVLNCNLGLRGSRLFPTAATAHNDDNNDCDSTILNTIGQDDQNPERGNNLNDSDTGRSHATNDQKKKKTKLSTKKTEDKSMKGKLERDIVALIAFFTLHGHYRVPYYYVVPDPGNENSCTNSRVRRYIYIYICICIYMYLYVYLCIFMCKYVYKYIYIYIHI